MYIINFIMQNNSSVVVLISFLTHFNVIFLLSAKNDKDNK